MRILIVSNYFWPENFRISDLATGLVKKGHEVTVMTGIPNYPDGKYYSGYGIFTKRKESYKGVSLIRVPFIPRGNGGSIWLALNYVSSAIALSFYALKVGKRGYDVTFVFEISPVTIGLPAIVLKKLYKIPIVFWVLDLWPESLVATNAIQNKWILKKIASLVRFIYSRCDHILVSSRGFINHVRSVGRYDGDLGYFPNWVESELLDTNLDGYSELPQLPSGFLVVYTGNIGFAQDWENMIDAADLARDNKEIHWVLVGDGRHADWLSKEVIRRKLSDNIHLVGSYPLDKMPYFYSAAGALLVSLRNEPIFSLTVPGKLQSYLATGKPIIACLEGEGAAIVTEAKAGLVCPAGDPESLAAAVKRLAGIDERKRLEMGSNGKEYCNNHFDREKLFDEVEAVLQKTANQQSNL